MRFLVIFIFVISIAIANEAPNIKNVVINNKLKIYDEITFLDNSKKIVKLSDYRGNLVLLNFWATWCAPCRREMPSLEKLTHLHPKIKVYAINMEKPNKLKAQDFFKFIGVLSLDIYFDPELKLVKQFRMRGLPTSILIDKDGKEFGRIVGEIDFTDKDFIKLLKKYI